MKSAIYGAISAVGMAMLIAAGAQHPSLNWAEVAIAAGGMILVYGVTSFWKEVKG